MKIISEKRCIIGEGPIWNDKEHALYYTNAGGGNEICKYITSTDTLDVIPTETSCAAFAFDKAGRLIVSRYDGVFYLDSNGKTHDIYDRSTYKIQYANDMKAGPDGRLYIGTKSEKRIGISEKLDGKLYSLDANGNVTVLLDGMKLSNGMEWSMDESLFYHTDSDTKTIREYNFDSICGKITFTGRQITVPGVDGFTIDKNDNLYVSCWGEGHIAVVDTKTMKILDFINVACSIPTSCCFCGGNADILAVTTASFNVDTATDANAGYTILYNMSTRGRKPYLFG